jgi:RNA polymerase sigma-70 factor (ECF subfamily)
MQLPSPESPGLDLGIDMSRLFAQLPSQRQTLLWLAHVEGYSHREIASVLGLREKSVRVLLHRARKELAGLLKANGWGPREA